MESPLQVHELISWNEQASSKLKLTQGSVQLDNPPIAEQLDDLLITDQQRVDPLFNEQLNDPPFDEQLNDSTFDEQLDDPSFPEQLDIIINNKIYAGKKFFNFYWC